MQAQKINKVSAVEAFGEFLKTENMRETATTFVIGVKTLYNQFAKLRRKYSARNNYELAWRLHSCGMLNLNHIFKPTNIVSDESLMKQLREKILEGRLRINGANSASNEPKS